MAVLCMILGRDDKNFVEAANPYVSGAELHPIQRQGGTNGNPDPCFILSTVVLANPAFAVVHPYLSGLPQKWSDSEDFPPELELPPED